VVEAPGNSYGLMVDAAAFFYEWLVKVVPSTLELSLQGAPMMTWDQPFLLAAFGASGHRTYGSGKRVLPDDDNFCLAAKRNLFTKLAYRRPFYEGAHRGLPGILLAKGDELRVWSPVRVPLQMDGEAMWLEPHEFPLTLTITDKGLRILSLVGNPALA
jgi:diacylglycerol kinase family enzyme